MSLTVIVKKSTCNNNKSRSIEVKLKPQKQFFFLSKLVKKNYSGVLATLFYEVSNSKESCCSFKISSAPQKAKNSAHIATSNHNKIFATSDISYDAQTTCTNFPVLDNMNYLTLHKEMSYVASTNLYLCMRSTYTGSVCKITNGRTKNKKNSLMFSR